MVVLVALRFARVLVRDGTTADVDDLKWTVAAGVPR